MGSLAQVRVTQPAYPTVGASVEQNFSSDLALPKVEVPAPFSTHYGGAITPQQIYSPVMEGVSFNAAELQSVSSAKVIAIGGGGAGAAASTGTIVSGGAISSVANISEGSVSAFSVTPITVRKHRDFVSADELLIAANDENVNLEKRRITITPGELGPSVGPVGDIPWLLLILMCGAYIIYNKVRTRKKA